MAEVRSSNEVSMLFVTRAALSEVSSLSKKVKASTPILQKRNATQFFSVVLGWYNDPNFPPNKPVQPGFDPIFGQTGKEDQSVHRFMTGTNPSYEQELMSFPHKFIDVRGGEYFFSPSISTMRSYIAAK